jgi:hypothetical protein
MTQTTLDQIKAELVSLEVDSSRLEKLSEDQPMTDLLTDPFKVSKFFYDLGVPIGKYGFDPSTVPIGRDFILREVSEEGYGRILSAGRLAKNDRRALELAEAGNKSILSLYAKLKVRDVLNLWNYEHSEEGLRTAA